MPSSEVVAIYRGPHGALIDDGVTFPRNEEVSVDRDHAMRLVQLGAAIEVAEPEEAKPKAESKKPVEESKAAPEE